MTRRQDGQRIRSDLVRRVAVGSDPIGADQHNVDLATAHQEPGRDVRDQRVCDAGLGQLPGGEPRTLEIRPRLVDPDHQLALGVMGRLDDPQRRPELAAGERPGVAVGQDPERPELLDRQSRQPELGEPAVVGRGLADDRVRLCPERIGNDVTIVAQLADRLEAGHHPVDRPAEVDRRRARSPECRRAGPEDRPPGVRLGQPGTIRRQGHPDGRDLADRRRAADHHLLDRIGRLGRVPDLDLDELIREQPLVDQVEDADAFAERSAEAGRGSGGTVGFGAAGARDDAVRLDPGGRRDGVEDRAGGFGRRPLEGLGGTGDCRRGLDQLARELAEEAAPGDLGGVDRWLGGGRSRRIGRCLRGIGVQVGQSMLAGGRTRAGGRVRDGR